MIMRGKENMRNTLKLYFHLVLKGLNFLYKTVLVPSFHLNGCIKKMLLYNVRRKSTV